MCSLGFVVHVAPCRGGTLSVESLIAFRSACCGIATPSGESAPSRSCLCMQLPPYNWRLSACSLLVSCVACGSTAPVVQPAPPLAAAPELPAPISPPPSADPVSHGLRTGEQFGCFTLAPDFRLAGELPVEPGPALDALWQRTRAAPARAADLVCAPQPGVTCDDSAPTPGCWPTWAVPESVLSVTWDGPVAEMLLQVATPGGPVSAALSSGARGRALGIGTGGGRAHRVCGFGALNIGRARRRTDRARCAGFPLGQRVVTSPAPRTGAPLCWGPVYPAGRCALGGDPCEGVTRCDRPRLPAPCRSPRSARAARPSQRSHSVCTWPCSPVARWPLQGQSAPRRT